MLEFKPKYRPKNELKIAKINHALGFRFKAPCLAQRLGAPSTKTLKFYYLRYILNSVH